MVTYRTVCFCLMVLFVAASDGQGIYSDYFNSNQFDTISTMDETILEDDEVPSAFLFGTSPSSSLSPPFIDTSLTGICENTSTIVCTGCRRVRICFPGISDQSLLPEYNCPAGTYCNTVGDRGACLTDPDEQFPECKPTTGIVEGGDIDGSLCTGLGLFPDPQDCTKFHFCTTIGGYTRPLKCPTGYVYNSKKKTCSRNARCQRIQCRPNRRSIFIPFPQDATYYAYCYYSRQGPRNRPVLKNVVVYKCATGSEFNSLSNSCVFKCSREGFFPKLRDPTKFYWCRKVNGKLFGYEQVCPGVGSVFSPRLGICLPPPVITTTTTTTTVTTPMTSDSTTASSASTEASSMTTESTNPASSTTSATTEPSPMTSESTISTSTVSTTSDTTEASPMTTESTTPTSSTTTASTETSPMTTVSTTSMDSTMSSDSSTTPTPQPVVLDEMVRLPPWPLWAPFPVSF